MILAGIPQRCAVIVDTDGTVDDLFFAVTINVTGADLLKPAALVAGSVPCPLLRQCIILSKGPCFDDHFLVQPTHDKQAGMDPVEICDTEHLSIDTVAVAVAPIADSAASDPVFLSSYSTSFTIINSEVLVTGQ